MTKRKYTEEMLIEAVQHSFSYAGVLRYLGSNQAGMNTHISSMIRKFKIDTSHFRQLNPNRTPGIRVKLTAEQIFRVLPPGSRRCQTKYLRRALDEMGVESKCNKCGQGEIWQDKFLRLEINHIDGDAMNCLFENLEYICPNCHSQETDTNLPHKNKNK